MTEISAVSMRSSARNASTVRIARYIADSDEKPTIRATACVASAGCSCWTRRAAATRTARSYPENVAPLAVKAAWIVRGAASMAVATLSSVVLAFM